MGFIRIFFVFFFTYAFGAVEVKELGDLGTYRVGLEYAAGRYIALDESYGAVSFLGVTKTSFNSVHFLMDLKALKLENSNWAASGGIGFRAWDKNRDKAYGLNVFYDYRNQRQDSFNQVGVGLELLSNVWDLHLNGYFPVGKTGYRYSRAILDDFTDGFFATVRKFQYALYGVELTAGRTFWLGDDLTVYLAPGFYYYDNKNIKSIQGIEGTAEIAWNDIVTFKVNASYDSRFKGRVQGVVGLNIPFDRMLSCISANCKSRILGTPIRRNDTIFLKNCRGITSNWDQCGNPD